MVMFMRKIELLLLCSLFVGCNNNGQTVDIQGLEQTPGTESANGIKSESGSVDTNRSQKELSVDVHNVMLNGIHLNDSLYKCFEIFGMPTEVYMFDEWPSGENIPPSLNRYIYGENEILSNNGPIYGVFTGFVLKEKSIFVVTIADGSGHYCDLSISSKLEGDKLKEIIHDFEPYPVEQQSDYTISIFLSDGVYELKNSYLCVCCDQNHVVKEIYVDYEKE